MNASVSVLAKVLLHKLMATSNSHPCSGNQLCYNQSDSSRMLFGGLLTDFN